MLTWRFADSIAETQRFASFTCCAGAPPPVWEEEVENYIRGRGLWHAQHVVVFEDVAGSLVAVSAFDEKVIRFPPFRPMDYPGWHLLALAIQTSHQGRGLAKEIFDGTFEAMRMRDGSRVLYTGTVHKDNARSLKACARVDLEPYARSTDGYIHLLGGVP